MTYSISVLTLCLAQNAALLFQSWFFPVEKWLRVAGIRLRSLPCLAAELRQPRCSETLSASQPPTLKDFCGYVVLLVAAAPSVSSLGKFDPGGLQFCSRTQGEGSGGPECQNVPDLSLSVHHIPKSSFVPFSLNVT